LPFCQSAQARLQLGQGLPAFLYKQSLRRQQVRLESTSPIGAGFLGSSCGATGESLPVLPTLRRIFRSCI